MAQAGTVQAVERVAGRYRLEGRIARGGMADVYRAHDESAERAVVLKRLRPELAARPNVAMLFQREYHTLARISHPRIIQVYDYGVDAGGPYYTMELLDGEDLRELAPLPWREACAYLRDVASSLALLHTRRLLHRDLSPRNVRRTGDGRVKLLDFGTMASFGVPRDVVGTAPFVSPEALRGVPLDHRADLYSLGALAYWLLTRQHAYRAKRIEDLPVAWQTPPAPPSQLVAEVPPELEDLVLALLAMDPNARPRDAADVIERLNAIAGLDSEELLQPADSYLLSASLVGRSHELGRLERLLDRTIEGRGTSVLIEANPGVGRTRMLAELSLRGQLAGALVAGVSADVGAAPYSVTHAIVHGLLRNAPSDTRYAAAPYLPALVEVLPELAEGVEPAALPEEPVEHRARVQGALLSFLTDLARERPLLILVDDFHRADETSAALLAALARESPRHALMCVTSIKLGSAVQAPDALRALRGSSKSLRLHRLRRGDTVALVESLFGAVPNIDRVAGWIHDITTGNATQTLELARHLVDSGAIRYAEGVWVLPSSIDQRAVPGSLAQSLSARLSSLSPEARALAARLSVADSALSLSLLARLTGEDQDTLFEQLDELRSKGVLEASGGGIAFVHEAMRELVRDELDQVHRQRYHQELGEAMLADRYASADKRVAAAHHLMRGEDPVGGARLVAAAARRGARDHLVGRPVPAFEQAVRIYEEHGLPVREVATLRAVLVSAGYNVERRLGYRYGESTVALFSNLAGLDFVERWAGRVGRHLAVWLGLGAAALRRALSPASSRGPKVATLVRYFAVAVSSAIGTMSVSLDVEGVRRLFARARVLDLFPPGYGLRAPFLLCRALYGVMLGRRSEPRADSEHLISLLEARAGSSGGLSIDDEALLTGALLNLGVCESYFGDSRGLWVAERLDRLRSYLAAIAAHRVRLIHHLMRGESDLAEPHRRAVELHGVQGGTTWQVELWSMAMEGLAALASEDYIRIKQLRQALQRTLPEVPTLQSSFDVLDARMARRLGHLEDSRTRLERVVESAPPRENVLWDVARLYLAETLLSLDRPGAARTLLQETLGHFAREDELHIVRVLCERLLAIAEARGGELERGRARIAAQLAQCARTGHPLLLARLHEAAAQLALEAGEADEVAEHLAAMRRAVEPTRNPALIALYQSLRTAVDVSGLPRLAELTPDGEDEDDATTAVSHNPMEAHVARLLEGADAEERAGRLLRIVLTRANATDGYLFSWDGAELAVLASTSPQEPPELLELAVRSRVEDYTERGADTTDAEPSVISDADSSGPSYRILVLPPRPDGHLSAVALSAEDGEPAMPPPAFLRAVAAHLGQ